MAAQTAAAAARTKHKHKHTRSPQRAAHLARRAVRLEKVDDDERVGQRAAEDAVELRRIKHLHDAVDAARRVLLGEVDAVLKQQRLDDVVARVGLGC